MRLVFVRQIYCCTLFTGRNSCIKSWAKRKGEIKMIVLGIIAIVIGGVLYFNGNTINNDLDAQMESVFNDGISNPGSNYETIGIFLLVVGIALLIIGTIVSVGKKDTNQVSEKPESEASSQSNTATCSQCGAAFLEDSKFCIACGAKNRAN